MYKSEKVYLCIKQLLEENLKSLEEYSPVKTLSSLKFKESD